MEISAKPYEVKIEVYSQEHESKIGCRVPQKEPTDTKLDHTKAASKWSSIGAFTLAAITAIYTLFMQTVVWSVFEASQNAFWSIRVAALGLSFNPTPVCVIGLVMLTYSAASDLFYYLETRKTDLEKEDVRLYITSELEGATLQDKLKIMKRYDISFANVADYALLGKGATVLDYAAFDVLGKEMLMQKQRNAERECFERTSFTSIEDAYESLTMREE